jgi:hypothetical protein
LEREFIVFGLYYNIICNRIFSNISFKEVLKFQELILITVEVGVEIAIGLISTYAFYVLVFGFVDLKLAIGISIKERIGSYVNEN